MNGHRYSPLAERVAARTRRHHARVESSRSPRRTHRLHGVCDRRGARHKSIVRELICQDEEITQEGSSPESAGRVFSLRSGNLRRRRPGGVGATRGREERRQSSLSPSTFPYCGRTAPNCSKSASPLRNIATTLVTIIIPIVSPPTRNPHTLLPMSGIQGYNRIPIIVVRQAAPPTATLNQITHSGNCRKRRNLSGFRRYRKTRSTKKNVVAIVQMSGQAAAATVENSVVGLIGLPPT